LINYPGFLLFLSSKIKIRQAQAGGLTKPLNLTAFIMIELTKKGEAFYRKWEKQRKHKWLFILRNGCIYWGLSATALSYGYAWFFREEVLPLTQGLKMLLGFCVWGMLFSYQQYQQFDTLFVSYTNDDEIALGTALLNKGIGWNYENLSLSAEADGWLYIRNEILWMDEAELCPVKIKEAFLLLQADFIRLKQHKDFSAFCETRKIQLQLFDNSESEEPLYEEVV
jgi:hypothetical protein